jgi:50S ribosomal subunit-associated GTPase HflX
VTSCTTSPNIWLRAINFQLFHQATGTYGSEKLEVVSARQRGKTNFIGGGGGETQIEMERRILKDNEANLREQIARVQRTRTLQVSWFLCVAKG